MGFVGVRMGSVSGRGEGKRKARGLGAKWYFGPCEEEDGEDGEEGRDG
jgi:hypothetical protein